MLKVGSVIDEFELKELLGQGGMGAVFAAWDDNLKRPVAVKVIALPSDTAKQREFRQRFKREAEALGRASQHPNIVEVHKSGLDDEGNPYLVMELLEGDTLQTRIERASGGRLSPEEVVAIVAPILGALAHVHDRGVIHRDVKPSNILRTRDTTGREVPKLIDFGVAKDVTVTLPRHLATATGQNPGTLLYMSPEQARGQRDLDARSDLYAMGVVLYVALSGTFPYDLDAGGAWLTALKEARPFRGLDERVAGLPAELVGVVHRALAADRDARFESAGEFCDALEASLRTPTGAQETLGAYRLIREIGAGGMGLVYEAEHTVLGRRVALKTLKDELAARADMRDRFLREGRAAAKVRHEHIVEVTDSGEADGRVFLAMELLAGENLAQRLKSRGTLSLQETADVMIPVCDAVATAHRAGVVHRDLKPDNLFLAQGRRGVVPKVLDFGVAKLLDATREEGDAPGTVSGALFGTPAYTAPELLRAGSRGATPDSDQFSLGVILYECLTGERPFPGEGIAVVAPIVEGKYTPLRERVPGVPRAVDAAVAKALSGKPAERFTSVWELARALLPYASEEIRRRWESSIGTGLDATDAAPRATRERRLRGAMVVFVSAAVVAAAAAGGAWWKRATPPQPVASRESVTTEPPRARVVAPALAIESPSTATETAVPAVARTDTRPETPRSNGPQPGRTRVAARREGSSQQDREATASPPVVPVVQAAPTHEQSPGRMQLDPNFPGAQ